MAAAAPPSSVVLKVASVPTDAHSETNKVYVAPEVMKQLGAGAEFCNINGVVFTLEADTAIPPDAVAMNLIQRRCAKVTTTAGDTITIPKGGHRPKEGTAISANFAVEYLAASRKGGSLDWMAFQEKLMGSFAGQYLIPGQQLLVVLGGMKYIATVKDLSGVGANGVDASGLCMLIPETKLHFESGEKAEISIVNIPDAVADLQQVKVVNTFDLEKLGIGGLRKEFAQVFRRAFASRIFPQSVVRKLCMKHAKGVVLFGPPGTGKTLIARKIGEILNCHPPKIVNGPEVFSKYVGQAEENVRKLFADAEAEQAAKGDKSKLHLIIFDEFDAICKVRGASRDNTGSADNVVNQLLSKIDGVSVLNNVLLIGMTNRLDLIDEAILRPGRFEVHVEIGLPDEQGRVEILRIHTNGMREVDVLGADVDLAHLAAHTRNFSGAELEGLVRAAQSHAFSRHIDFDNPTQAVDADKIKITKADFEHALEDVKPAFGRAEDECEKVLRNGIIDHGKDWQAVQHSCSEYVRSLKESDRMDTMNILLSGKTGSGRSAVAAHIAMLSEFPYVKYISANGWVSYSESQKANLMRKAFDDAGKSSMSVIVLDDLERLIEYSHMRAQYSNFLLQSLLVLLKRPPPEGKKILVVATCTNMQVMEELELADCFSADLELPLAAPASVEAVAAGLGVEFESAEDVPLVQECLPATGLPIKRLIWLLEMAAQRKGAKRVLTHKRFAEAILEGGRR